MTQYPFNPTLVALALSYLGGEADLRDIYAKVRELAEKLDVDLDYKNEASFQGTVRHTLESYCPQSENWQPGNEPFVERTDRGRYRVRLAVERTSQDVRGRSLS